MASEAAASLAAASLASEAANEGASEAASVEDGPHQAARITVMPKCWRSHKRKSLCFPKIYVPIS